MRGPPVYGTKGTCFCLYMRHLNDFSTVTVYGEYELFKYLTKFFNNFTYITYCMHLLHIFHPEMTTQFKSSKHSQAHSYSSSSIYVYFIL